MLDKIMGALGGDLIGGVGKIIDNFHTSDEEKAEAKLEMEALLTERIKAAEESTQARFEMVRGLIQAEMQSGDNYTKRARPTLVYFGMVIIFANYFVIPLIQQFQGITVAPFELPIEFWGAWGGVVGLWTVGRSAERAGMANKVVRAATGNKESGVSL